MKKTKETKRISISDLKWMVLFYAGCLAFIVLFSPANLWQYIFSKETWSPTLMDVSSRLDILFVHIIASAIAVIAFMTVSFRYLLSLGFRKAGNYFLIHLVLVGLVVTITKQRLIMDTDTEQKFDRVTEKLLAQLQIGMSRESVDLQILKINGSLIQFGNRGSDNNPENNALKENPDYWKVKNTIELAKKGHPLNFEELDFHGVLFNLNKTSPSKIDTGYRSVFVKSCCFGMFAWERYDLFITYNKENRLKSVLYLKSHHSDGRDTSCYVRLEIPSVDDRRYPYQCPPNVQNF